jgi:hypothetical protein
MTIMSLFVFLVNVADVDDKVCYNQYKKEQDSKQAGNDEKDKCVEFDHDETP